MGDTGGEDAESEDAEHDAVVDVEDLGLKIKMYSVLPSKEKYVG